MWIKLDNSQPHTYTLQLYRAAPSHCCAVYGAVDSHEWHPRLAANVASHLFVHAHRHAQACYQFISQPVVDGLRAISLPSCRYVCYIESFVSAHVRGPQQCLRAEFANGQAHIRVAVCCRRGRRRFSWLALLLGR